MSELHKLYSIPTYILTEDGTNARILQQAYSGHLTLNEVFLYHQGKQLLGSFNRTPHFNMHISVSEFVTTLCCRHQVVQPCSCKEWLFNLAPVRNGCSILYL